MRVYLSFSLKEVWIGYSVHAGEVSFRVLFIGLSVLSSARANSTPISKKKVSLRGPGKQGDTNPEYDNVYMPNRHDVVYADPSGPYLFGVLTGDCGDGNYEVTIGSERRSLPKGQVFRIKKDLEPKEAVTLREILKWNSP